MDTSDISLGAILSQIIGGDKHPILYISWKLFPGEKAYSIIKEEALVVKWATDLLCYYRLGANFTLVTDMPGRIQAPEL